MLLCIDERKRREKKNKKDLLHVEIEGVGKIKKGKWTYSRACAFGLVSEEVGKYEWNWGLII